MILAGGAGFRHGRTDSCNGLALRFRVLITSIYHLLMYGLNDIIINKHRRSRIFTAHRFPGQHARRDQPNVWRHFIRKRFLIRISQYTQRNAIFYSVSSRQLHHPDVRQFCRRTDVPAWGDTLPQRKVISLDSVPFFLYLLDSRIIYYWLNTFVCLLVLTGIRCKKIFGGRFKSKRMKKVSSFRPRSKRSWTRGRDKWDSPSSTSPDCTTGPMAHTSRRWVRNELNGRNSKSNILIAFIFRRDSCCARARARRIQTTTAGGFHSHTPVILVNQKSAVIGIPVRTAMATSWWFLKGARRTVGLYLTSAKKV